MPVLTITRVVAAKALGGIDPDTMTAWMKNVPVAQTGKGRSTIWLAASFTRKLKAFAMRPILAHAVVKKHSDLTISFEDKMLEVREFDSWLSPEMRMRAHEVRTLLSHALARSPIGAGLVGGMAFLHLCLPFEAQIMPYIITGDDSELPINWDEFAIAFALETLPEKV